MEIVIVVAVKIFITAVFLWIGMKLTRVDGKFLAMLIIAAAGTVIGLVPIPIPFVSMVLTVSVMCSLISKWTDTDAFPGGLLIVVIAWGLTFMTSMFLLTALTG
jgi:hypothetical protein